MFRTFSIIAATVTLGLGSELARADHEWRYVLGGALIGAAIGSIAADRHHHAYVTHGHRHLRPHHYRVRHYAHPRPVYVVHPRPVYRVHYHVDGRGRGGRNHRRHRH